MEQADPIATFKLLSGVQAVAFSQDSSFIAAADMAPARRVTVFKTSEKEPIQTIEDFEFPVMALTFSKDGKTLHTAGAGAGKVTEVLGTGSFGEFSWAKQSISECAGWVVDTKAPVYKTTFEGGPNCAYSPDGTVLAVLGTGVLTTREDVAKRSGTPAFTWNASALICWKVPSDGEVTPPATTWKKKENGLNLFNRGKPNLAWSFDGRFIATTSLVFGNPTGSAALGALASSDLPENLRNRMSEGVYAFSPDGKWLVKGGPNSVQVWALN